MNDDQIPLLSIDPEPLDSSIKNPPFLSRSEAASPLANSESLIFSVPLRSSRLSTDGNSLLSSQRKGSRSDVSTSSFAVDLLIFRNSLRRSLGWLFTGTKLRVFFVLSLIFMCLVLFVKAPVSGVPKSVPVSQQREYYWKISDQNPDVLEVKILPEEPDEDIPTDSEIYVTLQGKWQDQWETVSNWSVEVKHEEKQHLFDVTSEHFSTYRFMLSTNVEEIILTCDFYVASVPKAVHYQEAFAALILIFSYGLIISEVIDRSLAAMLGALLALSVFSSLHEAPSFERVVSWIDFQTTGLLFGMMILVGVFSETGFFEWAAVRAYKIARGDGKKKDSVVLMNLALILCIFTAVVSAFLDNVTTILLLSRVTIRLCDVLGVDPVPILISEALFSNIGGTATPIGDPPNIMVVNNEDISKTVDFGVFLVHVAPGIIFAGFVCSFVVKRVLSPYLQKRGAPLSIQKEIQVWEMTLKNLRSETEEERQVRKLLRQHIQTLMETEEPDTSPPDITELERKYVIHDVNLFYITSFVLTIVIFGFFVRSAFESELTPALIAIVGALSLLLAAGINKMDQVLRSVEWQTLIFFSCLFVLMECLSELGLIDLIGTTTANIIEVAPAGNGRLSFAIVLIIWVSAIVSAFVDNIPYTAAMIPVIVRLSQDDNLPLQPLVWSLVYGACLGGNGTLTGASANVVAAGISGSNGHPISFLRFSQLGIPVTIVSLIVVTIYMLIFHVLIPWY